MSFPETMKAIAIDKTGDVDVLDVKTIPFPAHVPGNVVIKVRSPRLTTLEFLPLRGLIQPLPAGGVWRYQLYRYLLQASPSHPFGIHAKLSNPSQSYAGRACTPSKPSPRSSAWRPRAPSSPSPPTSPSSPATSTRSAASKSAARSPWYVRPPVRPYQPLIRSM